MDDPRADGELEFHFEKSAAFRVVHVDGMIGGLSPSGKLLHMAVYSERSPIPKKVVHSVTKGELGQEIEDKREGKSGVFREVEADLVMPIEVAISLREWLDQQISIYIAHNNQIAKLSEGGK